MNRIGQTYISRVIAIFFLLFTVVDLATPHLCAEEMGLQSVAFAMAIGSTAEITINAARSEASSDSHRNESPVPIQGNEDCFCCCSHILPSKSFVVAGILLEPFDIDPLRAFLPTGSPDRHYHPPRLS